ncbi:MAG: hypothetical protein AB1489_26725 [Acidobacteriota bacterium]
MAVSIAKVDESRKLEELTATVEYLKGEVARLEEENARLAALSAEPLRQAEEILVKHGRSLSHKEIKELLLKEGVSKPVIDHIVAQVNNVLKKVKSASALSWDVEKLNK